MMMRKEAERLSGVRVSPPFVLGYGQCTYSSYSLSVNSCVCALRRPLRTRKTKKETSKELTKNFTEYHRLWKGQNFVNLCVALLSPLVLHNRCCDLDKVFNSTVPLLHQNECLGNFKMSLWWSMWSRKFFFGWLAAVTSFSMEIRPSEGRLNWYFASNISMALVLIILASKIQGKPGFTH